MFYLWLLASCTFLLFIFAQIYFVFLGIIPSVTNLALSIALAVVCFSQMFKKMKEPHEADYTLLAVGIWTGMIGFFLLIQRSNFISLANAIRSIECSFLVMLAGGFVAYYNTQTSQLRSEAEDSLKKLGDTSRENYNDKIFELVFDIEQVLGLDRVIPASDFAGRLYNCETYLAGLQQKNYPVSKALLTQISEILRDYLDLATESIQTEKCRETLLSIEAVFADVEKALESLYDQACQNKIDTANIKIEALETNLKLNGLLESDFAEKEERADL